MDCATNSDNSTSCMLKGDGVSITTTGALARAQTDNCEDNTVRYQSWQLENWRRKYEMVPGSPDATTQFPSVMEVDWIRVRSL